MQDTLEVMNGTERGKSGTFCGSRYSSFDIIVSLFELANWETQSFHNYTGRVGVNMLRIKGVNNR